MTYLTKKHLSRRTVLRAVGTTVALPLLDAMIPAATSLAATAAAPKLRAGFFYIPHGAILWNTAFGKEMDHWSPSGAGADFKLSPILSPLEKFKSYVTSFSNLENKANQNSVHAIVRDAASRDYKFAEIVHGVVRSDAFREQSLPAAPAGAAQTVARVEAK